MEVVAAFSAILAIVDSFTRVTINIKKCAQELKHAAEVVKRLGDETDIFADLLGLFHDTLVSARQASESDLSAKIGASNIVRKIEKASKSCLSKLQTTLRKVEHMRHDSKANLFQYYVAWLKWKDNSEEIRSIYLIMDSVKSSSNLLMTMIMLDKLTGELQERRAQGTPLPVALVKRLEQLLTKNRKLQHECRMLRKEQRRLGKEQRRLQADANLPDVVALTSEVMRTARNLIVEHVEEHPAIKQLLAERPEHLAAALQNLPPVRSSRSGEASPSVEQRPGTPTLTSSETASSSTGPSTVASVERADVHTPSADILGPSSRYRRGSYQVMLPDLAQSAGTTLRRRSAEQDLGEHYYIHMTKDDTITEGVRTIGRGHDLPLDPPELDAGSDSSAA